MKTFLISIDTEGDNQWNWKKGAEIRTENAKFLKRFQLLCEKYGLKPTYLTNYEMAIDTIFQDLVKTAIKRNTAEVGMHLHAWSTPPYVELETFDSLSNAPYLIEYSDEIMEEKIDIMTHTLRNVFESDIITHRSGRWALDNRYLNILGRKGYKVDCSVTPGLSWKNNRGQGKDSHGSDYSLANESPYLILDDKNSLIEIPMTILKTHRLFSPLRRDFKAFCGTFYRAIKGEYLWLRPDGMNLEKMKWIIDKARENASMDYVMFMLHSSEFMPGGSPTFQTEESIEQLYFDMEELFRYSCNWFAGDTIGNYGKALINGGFK